MSGPNVTTRETLRTLQTETTALQQAVAFVGGRKIEKIENKDRVALTELENRIKSVKEAMKRLLSEEKLTRAEAEQLLDSNGKLTDALTSLRALENNVVVIDKSSWDITKWMKKIVARIGYRGNYIELQNPVSSGDPSKELRKLFSKKFSEISKQRVQCEKSSVGRQINFKVGGAPVLNFVENIFPGFKTLAEAQQYLENSSFTEAEINDAERLISRFPSLPKTRYYIEKPEGGVRGAFVGGAKAVYGAAGSLVGKVIGAGKGKPAAQETGVDTGYQLRIGSSEYPIKLKDQNFEAIIEKKPVTWKSFSDLEAKQTGYKSGRSLWSDVLVSQAKEEKAISEFREKTGIRAQFPAWAPSQGKVSCSLDWDTEKKKWMFSTSVSGSLPYEVDSFSEPGTLKVTINSNPITLWPVANADAVKKALATVLPNKTILLSSEEVEDDLKTQKGFTGGVSAFAKEALPKNEFEALVNDLGVENAFTICDVNPTDKSCKVVFLSNLGTSSQEKEVSFSGTQKYKCEGQEYDSLPELFQDKFFSFEDCVSPAQLKEYQAKRLALMGEIEKREDYRPYNDDASKATTFKGLFGGVQPWYLAPKIAVSRPSWFGWSLGVAGSVWGRIKSMGSYVGLGTKGPLEAKPWDYCIMRPGKEPSVLEPLVLEPVLKDGSWKIKVQGQVTVYDSLDKLLEDQKLEKSLSLASLEKKFSEAKQKLQAFGPKDKDFGRKFFYTVDESMEESTKKFMKEHKSDQDVSIGCILFNSDKNTYTWLFAKEGEIKEMPIHFDPSGEIKVVEGENSRTWKEFQKYVEDQGGVYTLNYYQINAAKSEQQKKEFEDKTDKKYFDEMLRIDSRCSLLEEGEKVLAVKKDGNDYVISQLGKKGGDPQLTKIRFIAGKIELLKTGKKGKWEREKFTDLAGLKELFTGALTVKELGKKENVARFTAAADEEANRQASNLIYSSRKDKAAAPVPETVVATTSKPAVQAAPKAVSSREISTRSDWLDKAYKMDKKTLVADFASLAADFTPFDDEGWAHTLVYGLGQTPQDISRIRKADREGFQQNSTTILEKIKSLPIEQQFMLFELAFGPNVFAAGDKHRSIAANKLYSILTESFEKPENKQRLQAYLKNNAKKYEGKNFVDEFRL